MVPYCPFESRKRSSMTSNQSARSVFENHRLQNVFRLVSVYVFPPSIRHSPNKWNWRRCGFCYKILLVTPCLLTRIREFIHTQHRNTTRGRRRFRSLKIPAITLIWPKSPYKHSVTRSDRSGMESGRRSESPLWRHQWRSFVFISHADDVKGEIRLHVSRLLTNQKRESAQSMGQKAIFQSTLQ